MAKYGKTYINALQSLYGTPPATTLAPKARSCRKRAVMREFTEQHAVVEWLRYQNVVFHSIPNEGRRSYRMAAMLKAIGLQPGTPDLLVPIARGSYGCCYIEMKRQHGGRLTDAQKGFIPRLLNAGNMVYIAAGAKEAINFLEHYLAGNILPSNYKDYV